MHGKAKKSINYQWVKCSLQAWHTKVLDIGYIKCEIYTSFIKSYFAVKSIFNALVHYEQFLKSMLKVRNYNMINRIYLLIAKFANICNFINNNVVATCIIYSIEEIWQNKLMLFKNKSQLFPILRYACTWSWNFRHGYIYVSVWW